MQQARIKEIGSKAVHPEDKMLILFDESATDSIKEVAIIQEFCEPESEINLKVGDKICFDKQEYAITYLGRLANEQLNKMGHVTLAFQAIPEEDSLLNVIYLEPTVLPELQAGMIISYQTT